jgi:general secretion pathway protein G
MSASSRFRAFRRVAAFTLLELLAVIGVIAVLTALVVGAGRRTTESGKTARARAELAVLTAALESYKIAHGDYPRTGDPARLLQALIGKRGPDYQPLTSRPLAETDRFTIGSRLDPFTDETAVVVDPWGQPYRYAYRSQTPWTNHSFVLYSTGNDGAGSATLLAGGFPDRAASGNTDNLYAIQP